MQRESIPVGPGSWQKFFPTHPGQAYRLFLEVSGASPAVTYTFSHYNGNLDIPLTLTASDVTSGENIYGLEEATPYIKEFTVIAATTQCRLELDGATDGANFTVTFHPL